jgi:cellobiose-specific phosphotransferase system component IIC
MVASYSAGDVALYTVLVINTNVYVYRRSIRDRNVSSSDSVLTTAWTTLELPFDIWEGQGLFSSLLPDFYETKLYEKLVRRN